MLAQAVSTGDQLNFMFEGKSIRVALRDGEPWWVVRDVCEVLDIQQTTRAVERLDEDEVSSIHLADALGRDQDTYIVNEPGLYSLVLGSRKPEAKAFKRWITHEVLPQIRRTGSYVQPASLISPAQMILAMAQAMVEQERQMTLLSSRQEAVEAKVEAIEARAKEAEADALALPEPEDTVPGLSSRSQLNRLIRAYCLENGLGHQSAWNRLYMEYRDRFHVDLKARSTGKKGPLDVAEQIGAMKNLYALAHYLFGPK